MGEDHKRQLAHGCVGSPGLTITGACRTEHNRIPTGQAVGAVVPYAGLPFGS